MLLLIKILIAHFLGDFVLQPDSWVKDKIEKKGKSVKLYLHILLHIVLMGCFTIDTSLFAPILIIGVLHYVIDLCKVSITSTAHKIFPFLIDQLLHIASIVLVLSAFDLTGGLFQWHDHKEEILLSLLAIILLTSVLSRTIKTLISTWTPETEDNDEDSLKDAGKYIGILERLFIFGFVITNNFQAIGFLLAAKSVFRFGDLKDSKDRKLTEYILIGTLLSFGVSIVIGLLFLKTLNILDKA